METLGEVLQHRGQSAELAVIGGGSLLLSKLIERPTKDLDVGALVIAGAYQQAQPFPEFLTRAVQDVAAATGLRSDWLNAGPASQLALGLPTGFAERTTVRRFGALSLHVASREDPICFKLYASADLGPRSKHVVDLVALGPTPDELAWAAAWCREQDPSEAFDQQLALALHTLGGTGEH